MQLPVTSHRGRACPLRLRIAAIPPIACLVVAASASVAGAGESQISSSGRGAALPAPAAVHEREDTPGQEELAPVHEREDTPGQEELAPVHEREDTAAQRALAVSLAMVPGVLVHGTGSYVLGNETTAKRLLLLEGIGLGLIGVGGYTIISTGAARQFVGPAAALTIAGIGLFGISFLADVYAVTAPEGGFGRHGGHSPYFESELGYRYVYDPQFPHRHFTLTGFDARWLDWRLSPRLWSAPWGSNERLSIALAHRLLGAGPGVAAPDGSYLELESAWTRHTFPESRFTLSSAEASARGRLDMGRYDENLAGSFAELGVGMAIQTIGWEVRGVEPESATMLLARFGFGIYVGRGDAGSGEYQVYYDHRHDGMASGLLMSGLGSGVAGHFGLEAEQWITRALGLGLDLQIGSAAVAGISGLYRYGVDG